MDDDKQASARIGSAAMRYALSPEWVAYIDRHMAYLAELSKLSDADKARIVGSLAV